MKIKIISPANKMPEWVNSACQEFLKRFKQDLSVELIDQALNTRHKGADIPRLIEKESKNMLTLCHKNDWVIALSIDGKAYSSEALASQLDNWKNLGQTIVILIGGPEGLSKNCLERANQKISLSTLTLPHPLVRIMLIEQLYRAQSILNGHPYHK